MIRVHLTRRDRGITHNQGTIEFSCAEDATRHLAEVELAFGARVLSLSQTRIVVQTTIVGLIDQSIFEGNVQEIQHLLRLLYFYQMAVTNFDHLAREAAAEEAISQLGGIQRLVELAAPYLIGGSRLRIAVMLSYGITDPEDLEIGAHARLCDIFTALQLSREESCSFRDALVL